MCVSVWVYVCVVEGCESPVCNKSCLLNPAPELTLKQIHPCVCVGGCVCAWGCVSAHHSLVLSCMEGKVHLLDVNVVDHCALNGTEHYPHLQQLRQLRTS